MAQLVGHGKIAILIPCQGICLGCKLDPYRGSCRRQLIAVNALTSIFLSCSLSLKISKNNNNNNNKSLKIIYLKHTSFSYFEDSVQLRLQEGIVTSSSSSPRPPHEDRLK
ncbi:unnamed protein product [Pipistrellus nathusii]|uniref:Uncharacterized protein n=1 Tax=Pipistrellus nathusii TaxID=59473 RepID=A0ABP0A2G6_PIPNA